jgi:hypothetical protein
MYVSGHHNKKSPRLFSVGLFMNESYGPMRFTGRVRRGPGRLRARHRRHVRGPRPGRLRVRRLDGSRPLPGADRPTRPPARDR